MKRIKNETDSQLQKHRLPALLRVAALLFITGVLLFGQVLSPSISEPQANALRSVARLLAETPDRLDAKLEHVDFPMASVPDGWHGYPVVRKLEFAYLAAEKAKVGGGTQMLAALAQSLRKDYDSANYEMALKPLFNLPPVKTIKFRMTDLPPPAKFSLEPPKQRAIAAISKYTEGGAIGGPQVVLEHYFDLPPQTSYDILRRSNTSAEAITLGLSYVPERERMPRMQRIVARIDRAYAPKDEVALDPFRLKEIRLAEMSSSPHFAQAPGPSEPPPSVGNKPSSITPEGGGTGGSHSEPVRSSYEPGHPSYSTAAERYSRFVETRYPVRSGRAFTSMVGLRAGFGGIVLGNAVSSAPGLPRALQVVWTPYADPVGKSRMGEFQVRFAGGATGVYGPVDVEDASAAFQMLSGGTGPGGFPTYSNNDGLGLVSLEAQDERPRLTEENKIVWDSRFDITLHPALSRLHLGRSVVMCDAMPINRKDFFQIIEANRGPEAARKVEKVFSEDLNNWKITDATLRVGTRGSKIEIIRAPEAGARRSSEYRRQVFLSMQGFRRNKNRADEAFPNQFAAVALDIILSSEHYKRLNDFAAVFSLLRWARAQNAKFINPPQVAAFLDPVPPSLILRSDGGFELAGYSTEAEVLHEFYTNLDKRLPDMVAEFPPDLRSVARESAASRQEIENQQVKLAEIEQQLDDVRLDFRAILLRLEEQIPERDDRRPQLLDLEDDVEQQLRRSAHETASTVAIAENSSDHLLTFAGSIDQELTKKLKTVLEQYARVSAEFRTTRREADQTQIRLHREVQQAFMGDNRDYIKTYNQLNAHYAAANSGIAQAFSNEMAEGERFANSLPQKTSFAALLSIAGEQYALDSIRAKLTDSPSQDIAKKFAESESNLQAILNRAGVQAPGYLKAIQDTNRALLTYAGSRRDFSDLLERRGVLLAEKYPDWRSWWTAITCLRHASLEDLDFNVATN